MVRQPAEKRSIKASLFERLRLIAALSVALMAIELGAIGSARAQTDPQQKAAAEALFDEGRELMQQGQYESACKRFQQSQEIDRGVGTLLYLGECYERSGKLASAWAIFREAASAARAAGQGDRARVADERARKLAPGLSKLVLLVPQDNRVPGFEIFLDDRPLSSALFGVPFPVDAGNHEMTARAPGRSSYSTVIEIKGNGDYRSIQVPVLAAHSVEALPPPSAAPAQAGPASAGTDTGGGLSGQQLTALIAGGVGVLAIGAGVGFGVRARSLDDDSKQNCADTCSTRESADLNADARSSALVANVAYGVGIAALATGAILYFTADPAPRELARRSTSARPALGAAPMRLLPALGRGSAHLTLSGEF